MMPVTTPLAPILDNAIIEIRPLVSRDRLNNRKTNFSIVQDFQVVPDNSLSEVLAHNRGQATFFEQPANRLKGIRERFSIFFVREEKCPSCLLKMLHSTIETASLSNSNPGIRLSEAVFGLAHLLDLVFEQDADEMFCHQAHKNSKPSDGSSDAEQAIQNKLHHRDILVIDRTVNSAQGLGRFVVPMSFQAHNSLSHLHRFLTFGEM